MCKKLFLVLFSGSCLSIYGMEKKYNVDLNEKLTYQEDQKLLKRNVKQGEHSELGGWSSDKDSNKVTLNELSKKPKYTFTQTDDTVFSFRCNETNAKLFGALGCAFRVEIPEYNTSRYCNVTHTVIIDETENGFAINGSGGVCEGSGYESDSGSDNEFDIDTPKYLEEMALSLVQALEEFLVLQDQKEQEE